MILFWRYNFHLTSGLDTISLGGVGGSSSPKGVIVGRYEARFASRFEARFDRRF